MIKKIDFVITTFKKIMTRILLILLCLPMLFSSIVRQKFAKPKRLWQ